MTHRIHKSTALVAPFVLGILFIISLLAALDTPQDALAKTTANEIYYVNASTGDDNRTPTEAQNANTPWKTITHAVGTVPAGISGSPNIIQVAAGTYDTSLGESFPITMTNANVNLIGSGAGNSIIDGDGTDDILILTAQGIHVEGFTFQNAANRAVESQVGGFTINKNDFTRVKNGVYLDLDVDHGGNTLVFTDIVIISNTFAVTRTGVDLNYDITNSPENAPANITLGQVDVFSNVISFPYERGSYAIYYEIDVEDILNGQFTAGDINIAYNDIHGPFNDGIYFEGGSDDITGTTHFSAGNLNIMHNNLYDGAGDGGDTSIEIYYYYELGDHYGQAETTIGDVIISDNFISNADYGIYSYISEASGFHDDTTTSYGDLIVENNVLDKGESSALSLYLERIESVNDNAQVNFGEVWVEGNEIRNWTDGAYGIIHETDVRDINDSAQITVAPVYIQNNLVEANTNSAIRLNKYARESNDAASVILGDSYVTNNVITSSVGIWIDYDSVGQSVISETITSVAPVYVLSNTIVATETAGILIEFSQVAQNVSDNAVVNIEDIQVESNVINGRSHGLKIDFNPTNVFTNISETASITMPNIIGVNNLIAEADTGVQMRTVGNGDVSLMHTTVATPTLGIGTGIDVISGTLHLTNTLIASYTTGISNTDGVVSEDYTLFSANTTNIVGTVNSGGHSINGDADFVDPINNNYQLRHTSAAINAALDVDIDHDLLGTARPVGAGFDIGAYEYISQIFLPIIFK